MKQIAMITLFCSLYAMEYEPVHSIVPPTTLRKFIEDKTEYSCEKFLENQHHETLECAIFFSFLKEIQNCSIKTFSP